MESSNQKKYMTKNPIKKALIKNFQDKLIEIFKKLDPSYILDAGCGEGEIIRLIKVVFPDIKIVGLDSNYNSLNVASRKSIDVEFLLGDIYNLPFEDNYFDLVICCEVLEHLEQPALAMKELTRVCSKSLVLSVPHEPYFWGCNLISFNHLKNLGNAPGHINHWNLKKFTKFIKSYYANYEDQLAFPWIITYGAVI